MALKLYKVNLADDESSTKYVIAYYERRALRMYLESVGKFSCYCNIKKMYSSILTKREVVL